MVRLLEQNSLRESLKTLGEQKARNTYSIEEVGKAYMALLERFVEERANAN
ncbi:hypothetical protein D3C71_2198260 [compost metagenome]